MGNQTTQQSENLETLINDVTNAGGLSNGQNITIKNDHVITMTESNTILVGRPSVNEGELFIDGLNPSNTTDGQCILACFEATDSIAVGGQGLFKTRGQMLELGTTDGVNDQSITVGGTTGSYFGTQFVDVIPCLWIETGRRVFYTGGVGLAPIAGDYLYPSNSTIPLGRIESTGLDYLNIDLLGSPVSDLDSLRIIKVVDNFGDSLEVSWTATANGADAKEPDLYHKFINSRANGIRNLDDANNGIGGMFFDHPYRGNTLTLAGAPSGELGGFKPPTGCKILIPNIHITSATIADFVAGQTTHNTDTEASWSDFSTSAGGTVDLDTTNFGFFYAGGATGANKFVANRVGCVGRIGSSRCGTRSIYNDIGICQDAVGNAVFGIPSVNVQDNSLGANITDIVLGGGGTPAMYLGSQTSLKVDIDRIKLSSIGSNLTATAVQQCVVLNISSDCTVNDIVYFGNGLDSSTPFQITNSPNHRITNVIFSATQDFTKLGQGIDFCTITQNTGNYFSGLTVMGDGVWGDNMFQITDCFKLKFRAVGMIDDKIAEPSISGSIAFSVSGLCDEIDMARCWTNCATLVVNVSTAKATHVTNCSGKYAAEIQATGADDLKFRGLHGASGTPGGSTGIEDTLVASYGRQVHDVFNSDTLGYIVCSMITPSDAVDNTTVIAGNPKFFKDGDLDLANNDIIEIEQDYFSLGHITFTGQFTAVVGSSAFFADEWPNVDVFFQHDTGSGYNGVWLDVRVPANLTGIASTVDGVKFKFRFEATGKQNNMAMLLLHTTTTIAAQKSNLHPIDQFEATLTLIDIEPGSDVVILRAGTDVVLDSVDQGGTTFNYTYSNNEDIDYGIIKQGFVTLYKYGFSPALVDAILPISQQTDRAYI